MPVRMRSANSTDRISTMIAATRKNRLKNRDRKSTRLNSSHRCISYAVFCLKKKNKTKTPKTYMSESNTNLTDRGRSAEVRSEDGAVGRTYRYSDRDPPVLHSFPTRRSSDLKARTESARSIPQCPSECGRRTPPTGSAQ